MSVGDRTRSRNSTVQELAQGLEALEARSHLGKQQGRVSEP